MSSTTTKISYNGSRKSGPRVFEKNKVVEVPFEENPFENAAIESEKIENKLEHDRLRLIDFNKKVRERIRAYRFAERKLEQDAQLIIHKKAVLYSCKKKNCHLKRPKSALDLSQASKSTTSFTCSEDNLSNFALKTIENDTNKREQYKKRIKSTRKIYSNRERDQVRSELVIKNFKTEAAQNVPKKTEKKKLNTKSNVKIEKNEECVHAPKMDSNQELKIFVSQDPEKEHPVLCKPKLARKLAGCQKAGQSKLENYIGYMKEVLREKSSLNKMQIPPICQCHLNSGSNSPLIWEIDFTKCANNCLFYQNPKEYARVLFSLTDRSLIEREKLAKFDSLIDF
ncbi:coiled-coil domain-containing 15-like [Brachionus plicatilis]|uniref:Coiled-coil domain-containing 15-like n=1 Tax=Brachionus plicatilis TaxID=10195 RepID=A0A3M7SBY7_BRAPC|nr:coiled-coil domain-containing 15-like [Brachionus plicatilis]